MVLSRTTSEDRNKEDAVLEPVFANRYMQQPVKRYSCSCSLPAPFPSIANPPHTLPFHPHPFPVPLSLACAPPPALADPPPLPPLFLPSHVFPADKMPREVAHVFPADEMPREVAYQIVADMLEMDGKPRLNLASFVTTWMEPDAERLMTASLNKNAIDLSEYPACAHIQELCLNMLARLYHAPLTEGQTAVGTATIGSSEAIMLAGLAMKRRWAKFRRDKNLPTDSPNLVVGANTHVVVEKFANYFDVELRMVPVTPECPCLRVNEAVKLCDERTIGVVPILGSTYTGHFEDVQGLDEGLRKLDLPHGWQVPIHVDAASGGFVAPFLYPSLAWDFRLPSVLSISVSGHKYGLTYPGIAWLLFRNESCLPQELIYHVDYLGEDQPTFTLNFSRGASQIVGQYYQFLRLGFKGYRRVMENCAEVADSLREQLEATGMFHILSDTNMGIPLVAFRFKPHSPYAHLRERELSDDLRRHGWILPSYQMPPNMHDVTVLRVCVREDFSRELAEWLVRDIKETVGRMKAHEDKALARDREMEREGERVGEGERKGEGGAGEEKVGVEDGVLSAGTKGTKGSDAVARTAGGEQHVAKRVHGWQEEEEKKGSPTAFPLAPAAAAAAAAAAGTALLVATGWKEKEEGSSSASPSLSLSSHMCPGMGSVLGVERPGGCAGWRGEHKPARGEPGERLARLCAEDDSDAAEMGGKRTSEESGGMRGEGAAANSGNTETLSKGPGAEGQGGDAAGAAAVAVAAVAAARRCCTLGDVSSSRADTLASESPRRLPTPSPRRPETGTETASHSARVGLGIPPLADKAEVMRRDRWSRVVMFASPS
ncbi:unnamed protein product [Closterium sp. Naga37s-1]|nr:unnamed protein product [Closterium sp. Naga37s-1]